MEVNEGDNLKMIYAVGDNRHMWTILRGWHGCQMGQGSVLKINVDEEDVEKTILEYQSMMNEKTSPRFQVVALYCRCGCELEGEFEILPEVELPGLSWIRSPVMWCPNCGITFRGEEVRLMWDAALADLIS